ncbi:MAG TPA: cytochrome c [Burkholderiales bacterium]|nr:cytochrome c [Burkholderiales bacterium]
MAGSKAPGLAAGIALAVLTATASAQAPGPFLKEQVKLGADIYERNCAPCHGPRMLDSQVPVDLRKFPPEQKDRFITSVTKGKNQMPPWGGLFKPEEIEAIWAYVMVGEKQ